MLRLSIVSSIGFLDSSDVNTDRIFRQRLLFPTTVNESRSDLKLIFKRYLNPYLVLLALRAAAIGGAELTARYLVRSLHWQGRQPPDVTRHFREWAFSLLDTHLAGPMNVLGSESNHKSGDLGRSAPLSTWTLFESGFRIK